MLRNTPASRVGRILCSAAVAGLALVGPAARGASILVSRQSDIRATGASAAGEYRLSNGSGTSELFSDAVGSDESAVAHSSAQQYSQPVLGSGRTLNGLSADGAVRAAVWAGVPDAFSDAASDFSLVLRVEHGPALVTLAGTLGAAGDGSAAVSLTDHSSAEAPALVSAEVANDTHTLVESRVVPPGTYDLSAWGFARGTPGESSAFFSLDVTVRDADPAIMPMPLPSAASSRGLAVAVLVPAMYAALRRRRALA